MSFKVKFQHFPSHAKITDIKTFFQGLKINFIKAKNHGSGIIEFKNKEDALEAVKKDSTIFKNKKISLKFIENVEKNKEIKKPNFPNKNETEILEEIMDTGRLYVRNISYDVTEAHVVDYFKPYGDLIEVSVPFDFINKRPKGFAFVTFMSPADAVKAYNELNHTKLLNHKVHILPSKEKPDSEKVDKIANDNDDNKKTFHEERMSQLKSTASSAHNWNVMFVNSDAVAQFLADNLKITKSQLFNDSLKGSMSVKLAQAETQLVISVQQFLENNNINVEVLQSLMNRGPRNKNNTVNVTFALSSTTFIVKNLTPGVTKEDLENIFNKYDGLDSIILPPYGVTAIVTYKMSQQAKVAYVNCAYMPMNDNVLMLQWAPTDLFKPKKEEEIVNEEPKNDKKKKRNLSIEEEATKQNKKSKKSEEDSNVVSEVKETEKKDIVEPEKRSTKLIVKNLSFQATYKELEELFGAFNGILKIRMTKKNDEGHRGFAFLEFETEDDAQMVKETMGISTHLLGRRLILDYSHGV